MKSILGLTFLAHSVSAWLPGIDRDLDSFNTTHVYAQLQARAFHPPHRGDPGHSWNATQWGKHRPHPPPHGVRKIRGVNFGGWLVSEPWMMMNEWSNVMGCGSSASELDCMRDHYSGYQRVAGNQRFENHWSSWITPETVDAVSDVGLNTIRIPIGYWSYSRIVDRFSEPFADGDRMLPYLDAVVGRAADRGIYVVIDFHGAPGAQQQDAFTGQINRPAGFFNNYDYGRAEKWLSWMTNRIHTNYAYRTVGMIEVLNEPVSMHDHNSDGSNRYPAPGEDPSLIQKYYPGALAAVRSVEDRLHVASWRRLHVQFMSQKWLSGDPRSTAAVQNDHMTSYDDHNYIGFGVANNSDPYVLINNACNDSRVVSGQDFTVTGEWSMTSGVDWHDQGFFQKFFTAQQQLYEAPGMSGWMYWTWKTELNDPRWTYSYATALGYIPTNAADLDSNVLQDVCSGYI